MYLPTLVLCICDCVHLDDFEGPGLCLYSSQRVGEGVADFEKLCFCFFIYFFGNIHFYFIISGIDCGWNREISANNLRFQNFE